MYIIIYIYIYTHISLHVSYIYIYMYIYIYICRPGVHHRRRRLPHRRAADLRGLGLLTNNKHISILYVYPKHILNETNIRT